HGAYSMKYGVKRILTAVFLIALCGYVARFPNIERLAGLGMLCGVGLCFWGLDALFERLRQLRVTRVRVNLEAHAADLRFEQFWTEWERQASAGRLQNATSHWEGGQKYG
ncbi:MAG: hypothetical protein ACRDAM_12575, partial [Casimicrobium sp.]